MKNKGSLNLELALLIMLLALSVMFGLSLMGTRIADTFTDASEWLAASYIDGQWVNPPDWVGGTLEPVGGVDITTGVLHRDDEGSVRGVYVDTGINQNGSDGVYHHYVRVLEGGTYTLYSKDNTVVGLAGDWELVGDFTDQALVEPGINGSYYQVWSGNTVIGSCFLTDIDGMKFDYTLLQMLYYNDVGLDNLVMVAPSMVETLDSVVHSIMIVGKPDWCSGSYGFGKSCGNGTLIGIPVGNNLSSVIYEDGLSTIQWQFDYAGSTITNISLGESIANIGNRAFYFGWDNLNYVYFPDDLLTIGDYAFYQCFNLNNVILEDNVEEIGIGAFESCSLLNNIHLGNSIIRIGDSAFSNCSNLDNISLPTSLHTMENFAFNGCSSLTDIVIPNEVANIPEMAFRNCTSMTNITLGNKVANIGDSAFLGCILLQNVIIPNTVSTIDEWAFSECTSLDEITIPNNVSSIGFNAFYGCTNLNIITVDNIENAIIDSPWSAPSATVIWLR